MVKAETGMRSIAGTRRFWRRSCPDYLMTPDKAG